MVTDRHISLSTLPTEELAGVLNIYPWFGGARKELCRRMSRSGGEAWGVQQYAEEAVYIADRRAVAAILRKSRDEDWSDRDVERILKSYISRGTEGPARTGVELAPAAVERRVSRGPVPGDYFSQEDYDEVRQEDDNALSRAVSAIRSDPADEEPSPRPAGEGFCTETLAGIYAEQGYFEEAKRIYSQLLLAYPEKNAYFAALIEKMALLAKN